MFGIGMPELIIILVLALVVIGPQKLPELARSLGKGLGEFKRASNDFRRNMDDETRAVEEKERIARESAAKQTVEPEKANEAAASKVCA
jgi:sec-independent protein translocase protein TatA